MGLAKCSIQGLAGNGQRGSRGKIVNLVSSSPLVSSSFEAISPFNIEGKDWL
jgi:hypothetical protein